MVALAALSLALVSCTKETTPAATGTAPAAGGENPGMVVARFNGKDVTLKDVDATAGEQLRELDKQKFKLRQQAAEQFVIQALVKDAATKAGQSEEQFLKANIDGKVPPPSDDQISKVFEENKARMPPGATLDSMREQIVGFLTQEPRRDAASKLFEEMKKNAGFQMLMEEPRIQVEATGPMRGAGDAKITIVEFSDFECPFCGRAEDTVTQVMDKYAGKLKLYYRHFPLPFHANAGKAAEAAACAEAQGKFWEMHKVLFANQKALSIAELKTHAATAGLDAQKFAECLDTGKMKAKVDADSEAGKKVGVNGTPAFFINGVMISGAQPIEEFQKVIDAELAKK